MGFKLCPPLLAGLTKGILLAGRDHWRDMPPFEKVQDERGWFAELVLRSEQHPIQAERITVKPNLDCVMHRHPLVDSYEFPLAGSGEVIINHHHYHVSGDSPWRPLYIPHTAWHGGHISSEGAVFLSVQFWHGPRCRSVGENWENA